ncbi:MAG: MBL fold metallo-hydrolase [Candidatus Sumerlaeota bacterium]|nr:MBL fold metallo-hydrolase [Candidatus Sumerlaeota bacterium]
MEKWSEGVYLVGCYNDQNAGCWLLAYGKSGAILDMPPYGKKQTSPASAARKAARELGVEIKYLLGSHCHGDHMDLATVQEFHEAFPKAELCLQDGFASWFSGQGPIRHFDDQLELFLDEELLLLVHAPKHSWTDTMVIFRGAIITGDWELNTIRSIHDDNGKNSVPLIRKVQSINHLIEVVAKYNYCIHKVFSVHANDRRDNINFVALMEDTKLDRQLW